MTNDQPILSVRNLKTFFYQDEGVVQAVDGASFDIYAGRTLGIVGESGCGKSVRARSILRIVEKPGIIVEGEILLRRDMGGGRIQEIDLAKEHEDSRLMRQIRGGEIALIFQEPMTSLSPHYTVGNQIIEAIRLHKGLTAKQARPEAIELLRMVGIPKPDRRIDEYSFQLSGGLRQRVMIALALASDPRILIADEPTTALDVTTQAQILDLLRQLQEERDLAIILITHDMGVIAEMVDDVAVMYLGQVAEQGPVEQIFHEPKHPYTRSLLRSIPSIFAPPRTKLSTISGSIPHPYARPNGCPFHPRCTDFMAGTCDVHQPQLHAVGVDQMVSCFLYHEPEVAATPR
ncbi:MAG: ABC transporter ATP-binding protein [Caldilineaceae bacterium]|nr:ABC transporter ATP-binding protein [Caldilineaceae bacterium]